MFVTLLFYKKFAFSYQTDAIKMANSPYFDFEDFELLGAELKMMRLKSTTDGLDGRVKTLEKNVLSSGELEHRLEEVEKRLAEVVIRMNSEGAAGGRDAVPQQRFEEYVTQAVTAGVASFGVSKIFIRKFLNSVHGLDDTRYLRRRLNAVLKQKVDSKQFVVKGDLYTMVD